MNMDGPIALLALVLWVATLFVFFRMGADIKRLRQLAEQDAVRRYPAEPKRDPVAEGWAKENERKNLRIRIATEEAARERAAAERLAEMQAKHPIREDS